MAESTHATITWRDETDSNIFEQSTQQSEGLCSSPPFCSASSETYRSPGWTKTSRPILDSLGMYCESLQKHHRNFRHPKVIDQGNWFRCDVLACRHEFARVACIRISPFGRGLRSRYHSMGRSSCRHRSGADQLNQVVCTGLCRWHYVAGDGDPQNSLVEEQHACELV